MRNQTRRSALKTTLRKFEDAVSAKDVTAAASALTAAAKELDQVAASGTIHRNKAARKKSRLQKRLNGLRAAAG